MVFLSWIIHSLLVILSVAFFTLFERKVIGSFHIRYGPNKVSFLGLLQPLLDAIKLLTKQNLSPLRANSVAYHISPNIAVFLRVLVWLTLPVSFIFVSLNYSFVLFFCAGSIIIFRNLLAGWASNSKYSLIGSLRSVAQSISYEAVFRTLIVITLVMILSFSFRSLFCQSSLLFLCFFPVWIICTLAETHRAPFDFRESESELVSGFNTEYSGAYFAWFFLSEYSILLFSCFIISFIFLGWVFSRPLLRVIFTLSLSFFFIWIRITFCRFRYDMLMSVSWKVLLPFSLCLFMLLLCVFVLPFVL